MSKWTTIRALRTGGQGVTEIVVDENQRKAVRKKIKGGSSKSGVSKKSIARFIEEIGLLKELSSQRHLNLNIPSFLDSNFESKGIGGSDIFLCMEYVEGKNLTEFISQGGMKMREAIDAFIPLCNTVAAIHAAGIIHRDIKPDNIIVENIDKKLRFILVDFGLAHSEKNLADITDSQEAVGNRFIMLPETHYPDGPKHDRRSDVCQLVGIFFYLITGLRPLFISANGWKQPHRRPGRELTALNIDLMHIFDKGFSFDIEGRFQTVSELIAAIQRFDAGESKLPENLKNQQERFELANSTIFYRNLIGFCETSSLLDVRPDFLNWIFRKVEAYTENRVFLSAVRPLVEASLVGEGDERIELLEEIALTSLDAQEGISIPESTKVFTPSEARLFESTFMVICERDIVCSRGEASCITVNGPIFSCFRTSGIARNVYHCDEVINRIDPTRSMPPKIFRLSGDRGEAICWRCGDF